MSRVEDAVGKRGIGSEAGKCRATREQERERETWVGKGNCGGNRSREMGSWGNG